MPEIANRTITLHDESPTTHELIVFRAEMPNHTPASLWELWTTQDRIKQWWGMIETEMDLKVGGGYVFTWSKWVLRGEYRTIDPYKQLAFTWRWDGEGHETRDVTLDFAEGENGGAVLTVTQGTYTASPADKTDRKNIYDGWLYFLPIISEQPVV